MVIDIPTILLAALSPDWHCTYFPDTLYMTLLPAFHRFSSLFVQYVSESGTASHIISIFFERLKQTRWLVSGDCWTLFWRKMDRNITGYRKVVFWVGGDDETCLPFST
jgi:hypothetical protein